MFLYSQRNARESVRERKEIFSEGPLGKLIYFGFSALVINVKCLIKRINVLYIPKIRLKDLEKMN